MDLSDKAVIRLDKRSLELKQNKNLLESKFRTKEDDMDKHKTEKYQFRMQNKKTSIALGVPTFRVNSFTSYRKPGGLAKWCVNRLVFDRMVREPFDS